jgi:murein endopeptidase
MVEQARVQGPLLAGDVNVAAGYRMAGRAAAHLPGFGAAIWTGNQRRRMPVPGFSAKGAAEAAHGNRRAE